MATRRQRPRRLAVLLVAGAAACSARHTAPATPPVWPVVETTVDTRFVTRDHLIAAVEMQLSGEPLAQSMGRQLTGYSRDALPADQYFTPIAGTSGFTSVVDVPGFSTAVESYEYSKQPMNNLAFESGAGVSLLAGPVINPTGLTGAAALALVRSFAQQIGNEALTTRIITFDTNLGSAADPIGWPGIWPTLHPYESFDPSIAPKNTVAWLCSIASDDNPGAQGGVLNEDYECDATTLHLTDRTAQVDFTLTPGSSGWAGWKESLWTINYLQIMHDGIEDLVASVPEGELAEVGQSGNLVRGTPSTPGTTTTLGTYLGSSDIEGFQAGMMITELENQFQHWLSSLTTTDGAMLSGFGSIEEALSYDYSAPLRWIPEEIAVTEAPDPDPTQPFPLPQAYAIQSSDSSLIDLVGLLGAASEMYTLTDLSNPNVGGTQSVQVWFDGDPFPVQDQVATGEPTLHDRTLAMMRFLAVTLDRLHRDPATGILVDTVTFAGGVPTRGATIQTADATYALMALRTLRQSLMSNLSLYANTTPDMPMVSSPLDEVPFTGAPGGDTFSARVNALIEAQAALFLDRLTLPSGFAYDGWNVALGAPTDTDDTLDAHAAAIRGLLLGYLTSGDTAYRDRAVAVYDRMESVFFHPNGRIYLPTPWATAPMDFTYTPRRFGMLQGALRDMYELVATAPGQGSLNQQLEARIGRLNKLILNGWDDRNLNGVVDWPGECINVSGGLPRGGLQMAERALSGETGSLDDKLSTLTNRVATTDREHDCVPDISAVGLPSALADSIGLELQPPK